MTDLDTSENRSSSRRAVLGVVCALAACAIVFCGYSLVAYSRGADPLAFLSPEALQTVVEDEETSIEGALDPADSSEDLGPDLVGAEDTDKAEDSLAEEPSPDEDASHEEVESPEPSFISDESSEAASSTGSDSPSVQAPSSGTVSSGSSETNSSDSSSGDAGSTPTTSTSTPSATEPESEPEPEPEPEPEVAPVPTTISVTVVIDASAGGGSTLTSHVTLSSGASAYDALVATGADVNAIASAFGMYVSGIGGLGEKMSGYPNSGWLYDVNGVHATVACSSYVLSDGDTVFWHYTLDYTAE